MPTFHTSSNRLGNVWFALSILVFLATVYMLYLNLAAPWLTSGLGMLMTKLCWNLGDGYRYASRIYLAARDIESDPDKVRGYVRRATSYREIQDIRAVAARQYPPGSPELDELEAIIDQLWNSSKSD